MIEYEQQRLRLMEYKPQLDELEDALDLENIRSKTKLLEDKTLQQGFWE